MEKFATPENTIISTPEIAVEKLAGQYKPFIPFLSNPGIFLRQLHVFYDLAGDLWQGRCHLRHETPMRGDGLKFQSYTIDLDREWLSYVDAAFADAMSRGVSRGVFMNPRSGSMDAWSGARNEPSAYTTIGRMLDGNFHSNRTEPSLYLMRQLACRIIMASYVRNISTAVKSEFFNLVREHKLPGRWDEAQELIWASCFYKEKVAADHRFGYLMVREFHLMADLFELVLRQLQDPLT